MISLLICIFCILMYLYGNNILAFFDLQWQPWVLKVFFVGFLIFKYIFLGKKSVKLFKWYSSKYQQKTSILKRIIPIFFIPFAIIFILIMIGWEVFILSLMPKEYIVIRNGEKCVASVTSWHDSRVECFEYKGIIFMGEKLISYEIYQRTNDPFKADLAPFEK